MPVPEHHAQPLPEAEHHVGTAELCPQVPRVDGGGLQGQNQSSKRRSGEACGFMLRGKSCPHMLYFNSSVLLDPNHRIKLSPDEAPDAAGRAVTSRCPFLTVEKSRVVSEASVELQEDVQEMESGCKGGPPCIR